MHCKAKFRRAHPGCGGRKASHLTDEVALAALDLELLAAQDAVTDQYKEAPWRFGVEREVNLDLENAGQWTHVKDRWIWQLGIHCPDATGISMTLGAFDPAPGATLYVWNEDRTHFLGAFTEANEKPWGSMALGLLDDDRVVIEYQEPEDVHGQGDLRISQIVHGYRSLLLHPDNPAAEASMGPFGNSGACNINVNCPAGQTGKWPRSPWPSSRAADSQRALEPW